MTIKQQKIYNWLKEHKGYIKKGHNWVYLNNPIAHNAEDCQIALKQARIDFKDSYSKSSSTYSKGGKVAVMAQKAPKWENTPISVKRQLFFKQFKEKQQKEQYNKDNVIFIADLHAPWILDGYLDFCKEQQKKYDCGTVIFSGDIIDSGAWSYHEHDPDGLSVKGELMAAKEQLKLVFEMFPEAISLLGNHDLLISRKTKTAGLSQEFIRDLGDLLDAPRTWKFVHEYIKDNVRYVHGSIGDAFKRAVDSRMSTCQGHLHSKTFVQWSVSEKDAIFGLQVGAGFDRDKYAFDYAKPFPKKPIIGCGIILDKGTTPFVKLMSL